jgi:hypothetical protein
MTVYVEDAHAHVHRLVLLKMATMLEDCTAEEQYSVELSFVGKSTQWKEYS